MNHLTLAREQKEYIYIHIHIHIYYIITYQLDMI